LTTGKVIKGNWVNGVLDQNSLSRIFTQSQIGSLSALASVVQGESIINNQVNGSII
jgi:hypothetical protein